MWKAGGLHFSVGSYYPLSTFKNYLNIGRKTLVTGADDTQAGAFVVPDYTGLYEGLGRIPLALRNLITVRRTNSDTVFFVRQTAQITQAASVPEANVTTPSGATGEVSGEKPEGALGFQPDSALVIEIAALLPVTTRALEDAPQMEGIINEELRDDLAEELEDQIINGTGINDQLTGVLNTAGILTQVWNTDLFTTTRQALTTLLTTGRAIPTAWLMNPSDWETFDLSRDNNGQFYWGGPMRQGPPQLWGIPVVQSQLKTAGTAVLADWRKAYLFDRRRTTIQVTNSHSDHFARNIVDFRASMRAAFALLRPSAFVEVDLTTGS
jgi:HK97 family phage major capsid protein